MKRDNVTFSGKVKYTETLGISLQNTLCRKDPWKASCRRNSCCPFETGAGRCTKQGAIYRNDCVFCQKAGKEACYYGETARTLYERGVEQERAIKRMNHESPAVEHHLKHHRGEEYEYTMRLVEYSVLPLQRQAREVHMIWNSTGEILMNRMREWGQKLPPKLVLEGETNET